MDAAVACHGRGVRGRGSVRNQLSDVLAFVGKDRPRANRRCLRAGIGNGTGPSASATDAQAIQSALRASLREHGESLSRVPILYGGSVNPCNALELFSCADIDGGG
ncbi:triose-phosphate isomerase [Paraburkholderia sp. LFS083]|uniref:triose-phosphate isomerase n=1 Tax=Paraburkholderia TaxID=1822464 RepID=UPI003A80B5E8